MNFDNCKFIGLELQNSNWNQIGKLIDDKYHHHIQISKCGIWGRLFEPEPHITLYYSEENDKGPNWMYWLTTVYGRDLYKKLLENPILNFRHLVINTFRNSDAIVVKLDVTASECDQFGLLKSYNDLILSKCPEGTYRDYKPHITITYLDPNTDDTRVNALINDIKSINGLTNFRLTNLMLGGGELSVFKSIKLPLE